MNVARRRFRFLREIAEGGFGKVYLAEQLSVDGFSRIVAVKLLHAKWSSHDEVVMRTRDEARLLGLIRHQNIVRVEDLTSIDGKCAIVMEYLEGTDLKLLVQHLAERGQVFPRAALFEILSNVVSALDAAYNGRPLQGGEPLRVIHRDIKPSNIFLTVAGAVKVLDFGTARANFAEREAKTQALAFGSQGYMAPERLLGEEDTPAADIFSLGVTLYELLGLQSFGRVPPRPAKFQAKLEESLAALPLQGPSDWQDQVRDALRLMMAYEPKDRPAAAELVDIFELLATSVDDAGLRRFCRTTVAEAKASQPEVQSQDPLAGRVIDEDVSSAFGLGPDSLASYPPLDETVGEALGRVGLPTEPGVLGPESPPEGGRPWALWAVLGLLVVFLGILGLGGVGAVAWFVLASPASAPAPEPMAPAPVEEVPCRVVRDDAREDVARIPTALEVAGEVEAIVVMGGGGYKAEWGGRGACELGPVPAATYRTTVTLPGGEKLRSEGFEVTPGDACRFQFSVPDRAWEGGCE